MASILHLFLVKAPSSALGVPLAQEALKNSPRKLGKRKSSWISCPDMEQSPGIPLCKEQLLVLSSWGCCFHPLGCMEIINEIPEDYWEICP